MKQIFMHAAAQSEIQEIFVEHVQAIQGMVIGHVGRDAFVNFLKYGCGVSTRFSMHAFFAGSTTRFLTSIANTNEGREFLIGYEGKWNSNHAMSDAIRAVNTLFSFLPYRQRRGVLFELGKLMYSVLTDFDSQSTTTDASEAISVKMTIDRYEVLTDLEWIEDIMDANTDSNEY